MSRKSDLKKQIAESEAEIEELEKKRMRSQSAIMESFLNKTEPNERDAEYFRIYTQLIEVERNNLRMLNDELNKL
ncbi:MAG: hypothetical protein HDT28_03420 [Clostridiales bacterium]|nr:hypothetical protein [Clostridiales bacterium]